MPVAHVQVLRGHPRPLLKELLRELSAAYARVLGSPIDRLQVWITEVDPELYAISGVPADEALAEGERAQLEIPLVRLVLMEGRPIEQVQQAIAEVTEVVARVLGAERARIRVFVDRVPPDHWGIGGVPASVVRRAEIEGRR
jgi:4-oxalocrotonate tautomerase family enzyme